MIPLGINSHDLFESLGLGDIIFNVVVIAGILIFAAIMGRKANKKDK